MHLVVKAHFEVWTAPGEFYTLPASKTFNLIDEDCSNSALSAGQGKIGRVSEGLKMALMLLVVLRLDSRSQTSRNSSYFLLVI